MMRRITTSVCVLALTALWCGTASAQFDKLKKLKKTIDQVESKKPEEPAKPETTDEGKKSEPEPADASTAGSDAPATASAEPSYKAYQNYDFVPGNKIVFDDDFRGDTDGEFPAHWKLAKGQGVVNNVQGAPSFALTEGNYARVAPRVTTPRYLADPFTVEFDFYSKNGTKMIVFLTAGDKESNVSFGSDVSTSYFAEDAANQSASYPGTFKDGWHHAALVFKGSQMKCYEDQYRVLVIPDVGTFKPESVGFGGIGDLENPLVFTNVRIANGGAMTMIDELTKEGRIVTHGILFDVNRATVKPESMGTIRQVVSVLKGDGSLKLEIGGHTDSDGDAAKNLALSEARAEAVKKILVDQGIDASRLTTKGYGQTKPIDPNTTPEGKANNRRVEFAKVG
jgi:OOP family OmpA-OmpF porin